MMRFGIPKYRLPREILEGEIQRIVVTGLQRVRPGQTVSPSPATPPPAISPAAEQGTSGGAGDSAAGDGPSAPKATQ